MQIKADLHVHSYYSKDSLITPKDLVYYAKNRGLNAVAVTDHNQIEGSLKIAKETDFLVIPGMEVSSAHGHIVALNLRELVPRGLSAEETVDHIHEAGGIAIAVHPYAWMKGSLTSHVQEAKFDAIETVNANAFPFGRCRKRAQETARTLDLPCVGGTDAHYGPMIGYGYTVIDSENNVEAIAKGIVEGKCEAFGRPVPLTLNLERQIKLLRKRKPPLETR
jgi:predicted metal-dependent phosphoesterase TrpH